MSKIIVTGVTGNAGSAILEACLASSSVAHVTSISRKPSYITHPKLDTVLIPSDKHPGSFADFPDSVVKQVEDHNSIIWALGISSAKVSKEEYIKITYDYAMSAAKKLSHLGTPENPFRFVLISGLGADQSGKTRTLFGKIKGRTEKDLMQMENKHFQVIAVRPGMIVPTAQHGAHMAAGERRFLTIVGPIAKWIYANSVDYAEGLGRGCVNLALGKFWGLRDKEGVIQTDALKKTYQS